MAKDKNLFTRFQIFNREFVVLQLETGETLKGYYVMEGEIVHLITKEEQDGKVVTITKDILVDDIKKANFPSFNSNEVSEYKSMGRKR